MEMYYPIIKIPEIFLKLYLSEINMFFLISVEAQYLQKAKVFRSYLKIA
jgi:hypothetical protein